MFPSCFLDVYNLTSSPTKNMAWFSLGSVCFHLLFTKTLTSVEDLGNMILTDSLLFSL